MIKMKWKWEIDLSYIEIQKILKSLAKDLAYMKLLYNEESIDFIHSYLVKGLWEKSKNHTTVTAYEDEDEDTI